MSVASRCLVVQRSSFSQHSTSVVTLVLAVVWLVLCADPMSASYREPWCQWMDGLNVLTPSPSSPPMRNCRSRTGLCTSTSCSPKGTFPLCSCRGAPHAVTTLVGRLVNGGGDGGGSHGCVVGVASAHSSAASFASTLLCFVYLTDLCSCSRESYFHPHLTCCKHSAICGIDVKV